MADNLCICHHWRTQHNYGRDGCALPECNCRGFVNAETLADLRVQVARLEGELARMKENRNFQMRRAWKAELANTALAAALDYLKLFRAGLHGLSGKQQVDAVHVQDALDHGLGLAALPDAGEGCDICGVPWEKHEAPPYECEAKRGEGWLPPDKVESVAARLRSASRVFHSGRGHAGQWRECKHLQCSQDRAALDAVKGE